MRRFAAIFLPAVVAAVLPTGLAYAAGSDPPRPSASSAAAVSLHDGDTVTAPASDQAAQQFAARDRGMWASNQVIIVFKDGVTPSGGALPNGAGLRATTNNSRVNSALQVLKASSLRPAFSTPSTVATGASLSALSALTTAARTKLGSQAVDLANVYVAQVAGAAPAQAAQVLRATPGIAFAEPDFTVSVMNTGGKPVNTSILPSAQAVQRRAAPLIRNAAGNATPSATPGTDATAAGLPANYGLTSSYQSYLNVNGVNAASAYATIAQRFGQVPGQGETITNVSLGDLTDQSMGTGNPTTIVSNGQRYLDYPSLPLIPTYVALESGGLNPLGSVERVDPNLGEVLLDFSVMAPLPHDQQRPDGTGSGASDLLGIAPGASYRLVEPQTPSFSDIDQALLAAAQQAPHPDVITASLGYAFDQYGFAGRYLEDDPIAQTIIAGIVQGDGIVVCVAANDGTRMFTPAAVGPDGGSVATDLAQSGQAATTMADDGLSGAPSEVPDSGAIAVGGTTLDDTVAVPPQDGGPQSSNPMWAETRTDGATNFSSGFGTRINVSAPSDNIAALMHQCPDNRPCQATDAVTMLDGGTSASAPMTAAAAAVALQVARLTGQKLDPAGVRTLLEHTGRAVPTPPQIDRQLQVGPQIDVGAAVSALLATSQGSSPQSQPQITRFSIAQRQAIGALDAEFEEATNPTAIDLAGPDNYFVGNTGEDLVGPITFGVDGPGIGAQGLSYALTDGSTTFSSSLPYVRVTPAQLFTAAGQQLVSADPRSFPVTFEVLRGNQVVSSATQQLTFGPTDGTHAVAPAPVVPPVVTQGQDVTVHYDLTGVRNVSNPKLLVSSVGHWSNYAAPRFRAAYSIPLTATSGTVTIPASDFQAGGAGIYGVGIQQNDNRWVGAFAPVRVDAGTSPAGVASDISKVRPDAPLLSAPGWPAGHEVEISRAHPQLGVSWDVRGIPGATGAMVEFSAPGPTIAGLYNTFTNANGSQRDQNGVDSGSAVYQPLPAKSGSVSLDALKLGLVPALNYSVRVLATHGGSVTGQASGSSYLQLDDGLAPNGGFVSDFSIVPGGGSTVATHTYDGNGNWSGSTLQAYDPSTGSYGKVFASDTSGNSGYYVFGADSGLGRTLAVRKSWTDGTSDVQVYNSTTGQQVSDTPMDGNTQYSLVAGRVDAAHHRADLLTTTTSGNVDTLLPLDLSSGNLGTPINLDNGTGPQGYEMLDVDQSTGSVIAARDWTSEMCTIKSDELTVANPASGTAKPPVNVGRCLTGIASDQAGGSAYLTFGQYTPNQPQKGAWSTLDESSLSLSARQALDGGYVTMFPTIDAVHHLAVVGFLATADYATNNNAMSAIGVYDLKTGKLVSMSPDFNYLAWGADAYSISDRGIQLDPATRTGWTYGPGNSEVQQFTY